MGELKPSFTRRTNSLNGRMKGQQCWGQGVARGRSTPRVKASLRVLGRLTRQNSLLLRLTERLLFFCCCFDFGFVAALSTGMVAHPFLALVPLFWVVGVRSAAMNKSMPSIAATISSVERSSNQTIMYSVYARS